MHSLQLQDQWLKYKFGGPGTIEMMGALCTQSGAPARQCGSKQFCVTHLVSRCEKLREFAALSKQACMRQHDGTVQFVSYRLIVKLDQECGGMQRSP